jgi:hypothetical protein
MSVDAEPKTFCAVHMDRETSLRCNKCDRYMCVQCAVRTPVGYRCRECARQQENKFFSATSNDYLIVAGVCGVAGLLLGLITAFIPFIASPIFAIILGLPLGGGIAEVALRLTGRRRGRYSGEVGAAATIIVGVIAGIGSVYYNYLSQYNQLVEEFGERVAVQIMPPFSLTDLLSMNNIGLLIFVCLAAFAVYGRYRMKM